MEIDNRNAPENDGLPLEGSGPSRLQTNDAGVHRDYADRAVGEIPDADGEESEESLPTGVDDENVSRANHTESNNQGVATRYPQPTSPPRSFRPRESDGLVRTESREGREMGETIPSSVGHSSASESVQRNFMDTESNQQRFPKESFHCIPDDSDEGIEND